MTSSYIRPLYTVILLVLTCPFASAAEDYVAFVDTNVLDVENAQVLPDRTVIVRGEHISGIVVADTPLPAGVTIINASGKYLAPGPDGHAYPHRHTRRSGADPRVRSDHGQGNVGQPGHAGATRYINVLHFVSRTSSVFFDTEV